MYAVSVLLKRLVYMCIIIIIYHTQLWLGYIVAHYVTALISLLYIRTIIIIMLHVTMILAIYSYVLQFQEREQQQQQQIQAAEDVSQPIAV